MEGKPRVVLDTNVFLRVILSKKPEGVAAAIWSLFQAGAFQLITSEPLLNELTTTLQIPELTMIHHWSPQRIHEYVQSIREIAVVTPGITPIELPELEQRDPSDLPFLIAAVEGQAAYLVTQDPDLLDLGSFCDITILDPLHFLKNLRAFLK